MSINFCGNFYAPFVGFLSKKEPQPGTRIERGGNGRSFTVSVIESILAAHRIPRSPSAWPGRLTLDGKGCVSWKYPYVLNSSIKRMMWYAMENQAEGTRYYYWVVFQWMVQAGSRGLWPASKFFVPLGIGSFHYSLFHYLTSVTNVIGCLRYVQRESLWILILQQCRCSRSTNRFPSHCWNVWSVRWKPREWSTETQWTKCRWSWYPCVHWELEVSETPKFQICILQQGFMNQ